MKVYFWTSSKCYPSQPAVLRLLNLPHSLSSQKGEKLVRWQNDTIWLGWDGENWKPICWGGMNLGVEELSGRLFNQIYSPTFILISGS